jgi:hypothetical protein
LLSVALNLIPKLIPGPRGTLGGWRFPGDSPEDDGDRMKQRRASSRRWRRF